MFEEIELSTLTLKKHARQYRCACRQATASRSKQKKSKSPLKMLVNNKKWSVKVQGGEKEHVREKCNVSFVFSLTQIFSRSLSLTKRFSKSISWRRRRTENRQTKCENEFSLPMEKWRRYIVEKALTHMKSHAACLTNTKPTVSYWHTWPIDCKDCLIASHASLFFWWACWLIRYLNCVMPTIFRTFKKHFKRIQH